MSENPCPCNRVAQTVAKNDAPAWVCEKCKRLFIPANSLYKRSHRQTLKERRELTDLRAQLAKTEAELHQWRTARTRGGCAEDLNAMRARAVDAETRAEKAEAERDTWRKASSDVAWERDAAETERDALRLRCERLEKALKHCSTMLRPAHGQWWVGVPEGITAEELGPMVQAALADTLPGQVSDRNLECPERGKLDSESPKLPERKESKTCLLCRATIVGAFGGGYGPSGERIYFCNEGDRPTCYTKAMRLRWGRPDAEREGKTE